MLALFFQRLEISSLLLSPFHFSALAPSAPPHCLGTGLCSGSARLQLVTFELVDSNTAKLLETNSEMSAVPLAGKYLSEIEAVGIFPACGLTKYDQLIKFTLTFCLESYFPGIS